MSLPNVYNRQIFFHSLGDLENFLVKCLEVETKVVHNLANKKIYIDDLFGRTIVRYRVSKNNSIVIEQIYHGNWYRFHIFEDKRKYKRDLYKDLKFWYKAVQFRLLEDAFL